MGTKYVRNIERDDEGWFSPREGAHAWRYGSQGIEVARRGDPSSLYRPSSKSQPRLARHVYQENVTAIHGAVDAIWPEAMGHERELRLALLLATATNESAGNPLAERYEAHLKDSSFGLCQILTTTAFQLGNELGFPKEVASGSESWRMPAKTFRADPSTINDWRSFLASPRNSFLLCAYFHRQNDERWGAGGDPLFLYACYNAGSPRLSKKNPWGLIATRHALDAFANFFNDFLAYLRGEAPAQV